MNSSTSNFKRNILLVALALACMVTAEYVARAFFPLSGRDDSLKEQILSYKPTYVLIGTSPLQNGVDPEVFEEELSKLTGKEERVVLWYKTALLADYWYLVVKNQVRQAVAEDPSLHPKVGIVYTEYTLTNLSYSVSDKNAANLRNQQYYADDTYMQKMFGHKAEWKDAALTHLSLYFRRSDLSTKLVNNAAALGASALGLKEDLLPLLKNRFSRDALITDKESYIAIEDLVPEELTYDLRRFDEVVGDTFLPDIIKEGEGMDLFFVELPMRPSDAPTSTYRYKEYRPALLKYLADRNVPHVSVYDDEDLELRDDMFRDRAHVTDDYRPYVTKSVAKEIFEQLEK